MPREHTSGLLVARLLLGPLAVGLALLLCAGCGSDSKRASVSGRVTVDGRPLAEGSTAGSPVLVYRPTGEEH
jgi:hypothetical protein